MLISDKQQEANRQNAQHSTGPTTPEGKAAVRLNALTYGLRARSLLIPGEDPEEYKRLWADLVAEWQPQGRTERLALEQMATGQWLIARMAVGERKVYEHEMPMDEQLTLLDRISLQRTRLERSFAHAMHTLEHLQQKRSARGAQRTAQPEPRPRVYLAASEGTEDHTAFFAPIAPDSR